MLALATASVLLAGATASAAQAAASPGTAAWHLQAQWYPDLVAAENVACPGASTCYVVGTGAFREPRVLRTTDLGTTWRSTGVRSPTGGADLLRLG